jgi:transposase-like protein
MNQKSRKHYTPELKAQVIELLGTDKPVPQIAEELCISSSLLYRWKQDSHGSQPGSEGSRAVGEGDMLYVFRVAVRIITSNGVKISHGQTPAF